MIQKFRSLGSRGLGVGVAGVWGGVMGMMWGFLYGSETDRIRMRWEFADSCSQISN